jgi:pilus assembly protein CpaB
MQRRGVLFLTFAILLGLGAAWSAHRAASRGPLAAAEVQMVPVVVARTDIATASVLDPAAFTTTDWPREHLPEGALTSATDVAGRVARRPIAAGEPVLESALYERGHEGGLGAVISPAHRAISVKVDSVIGVAGFVKPGSHVDVLATLRRVDRQKAFPESKLFLQDVRVLAIDQQLEEARDGKPELGNVVTLEVDPEQAELLIYAAHEGRLQLALRTPGDEKRLETTGVTVADVLGDPKAAGAPSPRHMIARASTTVEVLRGAKMETMKF